MPGRVLEHDLVGGFRPSGRVFAQQMTGTVSGAKGKVLEHQTTTNTTGAPGSPTRGRVFEHQMSGDSPNLVAVLSVTPAGRPLRPLEPFTITAVNSSGTPISWSFAFAPGSPTTVLTGSGGTRTGLAPVVYVSPIVDGAGIWTGTDNPIYMTVVVTVSDGVDEDTATIQVPIAPHLVWMLNAANALVPVLVYF
jgi:hypothetical protein